MGRIRTYLFASTLCALCAWLCPARAEPLRAVLWVADPSDRSLLRRVRGQTSDLDVALEAVEAGPTKAAFAEQLETARSLGARVVIWAVRSEQALALTVADFALERVLVRRLEGVRGASAQEEAAALVARSALRASLAGSALGQPAEQLAPAAVPTVELEALPVPVPSAERSWHPGLEFGVLSGLDGASARGHHASFLRASLRWRQVELGLLGGYGMPVRVEERRAWLRLASHRIEASAGWLLQRHAWSLVPSVALGLRIFRLTAEAREPSLAAEDARASTLSLGAFVRIAYQPHRVGLSLRLGFELLPNAPALGYRTATDFVRTERLWFLQPQLAVALTF